jgi:hypothetical protein|tara:strand:- start:7796 stop:8062 length:267 start_codon:yes stop_codon:yes gene_type:complete
MGLDDWKIKQNNTTWTSEYPTEFGMTSFLKDKIFAVSNTGKSVLVHMMNGQTFTVTIKNSPIPFFKDTGLTNEIVIKQLKGEKTQEEK